MWGRGGGLRVKIGHHKIGAWAEIGGGKKPQKTSDITNGCSLIHKKRQSPEVLPRFGSELKNYFIPALWTFWAANSCKGQLISKANSTIFTWTKKRTKYFSISALEFVGSSPTQGNIFYLQFVLLKCLEFYKNQIWSLKIY